MNDDKPEIKPEVNEPAAKSEFDKPEIKPAVNQPAPKSEFDNPPPRSEFDHPEIKPRAKPKIKIKKERQPLNLNFKFKFLFIILILGLGIYFGGGPLLKSAAKFLIGRVFVGSDISIGSLSIKPTHQIRFSGVLVKKGQIYDMTIQEASLDFTWPALFKKIMPELSLKNVKFTANSPKVTLKDLLKSIKLGAAKKGPVKKPSAQAKAKASGQEKTKTQTGVQTRFSLISKLNIPDLSFDLDIKDVRVNGLIAFSLNLQDAQVDFLNLSAKRLGVGRVYLQGLDLNALQGQRQGSLEIKQAHFANLKVKNIKSEAVLEGTILSLDGISGEFLSKKLSADMTLNLWPIMECTANAKVVGFLASAFAKELGWENKMKVSGKLYAKAILRSEGNTMAMLNVNFISSPAGPVVLAISDPQTLQAIAKHNKLSLANVSESFRDYSFEKGKLSASLFDSMTSLEITLNGQQGRRNLKFNLEDTHVFGIY